jgi:hypothetical protein
MMANLIGLLAQLINGNHRRNILLYMPDPDWQNHPEELDNLMPWSKVVQAECGK